MEKLPMCDCPGDRIARLEAEVAELRNMIMRIGAAAKDAAEAQARSIEAFKCFRERMLAAVEAKQQVRLQ